MSRSSTSGRPFRICLPPLRDPVVQQEARRQVAQQRGEHRDDPRVPVRRAHDDHHRQHEHDGQSKTGAPEHDRRPRRPEAPAGQAALEPRHVLRRLRQEHRPPREPRVEPCGQLAWDGRAKPGGNRHQRPEAAAHPGGPRQHGPRHESCQQCHGHESRDERYGEFGRHRHHHDRARNQASVSTRR